MLDDFHILTFNPFFATIFTYFALFILDDKVNCYSVFEKQN
jgi:hypothetical protein